MIKTVGLETAKALKEIGFNKDTYFWHIVPCQSHGMIPWGVIEDKVRAEEWNPEYTYAAPTTDELLEELPYSIIRDGESYFLEVHKYDSYYRVFYRKYEQIHAGEYRFRNLAEPTNNSLPEALAAMWLWLNKQDLLKTKG